MGAPVVSPVPWSVEWYRRYPMTYPKLSGWGGKTAGAGAGDLGGDLSLDTGGAAQPAICIDGEYANATATFAGNAIGGKIFTVGYRIQAVITVMNAINASNRDSQVGIGLGFSGAEVSDSPTAGTVRLYARCDSNPVTFELFTAPGGSVPGTFWTMPTLPTGPNFFASTRLTLIFFPGIAYGIVDGRLGAVATGASVPTAATARGAIDVGPGMYTRCGPAVADETIGGFRGFQVERIGRP